MIAVCIATYNHEAFIAQAIESVLAQVCDEPIRVYIGDDASTDGTQAVCERYAADQRIVYVRREKNLGLVSNTIDLYRRIMADGAEYIAMLDGDDYWTDEKKLQRQVDYLREHPEVGFVHTAAEGQGDETIPTGDLSQCYDRSGARQTNSTVLFRASLLHEADLAEIEQQGFPVLDYPSEHKYVTKKNESGYGIGSIKNTTGTSIFVGIVRFYGIYGKFFTFYLHK